MKACNFIVVMTHSAHRAAPETMKICGVEKTLKETLLQSCSSRRGHTYGTRANYPLICNVNFHACNFLTSPHT